MMYRISLSGSSRFPNFRAPTGQTSTHACSVRGCSGPLDAEGALLDDAHGARPVPEIVRLGFISAEGAPASSS